MRYRSLPLIAAGLLVVAFAQAQAAQLVPTPRAELMPASATNRPFLAAASALAPVDLAARGYTEDELVVSGQANIYDWASAGARQAVSVRTPRLRYSTRMLVRRPLDTTKFSGRVIVELLDATEKHDIAPLWGFSHEHFLRTGDIWVGITMSPDAIAALLKFDPIRYASLEPVGRDAGACASGTGLAWDQIAQAGALLRSTSRENPLRSYSPRRVILAGYAQGGGLIVPYINAQHAMQRLGDGEPIFDAYLSAAVATSDASINSCAAALPAGDARRALSPRDAPVVVVRTQSELQRAPELNRADSDEPGDVYRQYEIAGAAHSGPFPAGRPAPVDLQIAGLATRTGDACREPRTDFPAGLAFNAIWRQLDRLLVDGEAMDSAPRIEVDARGAPLLDQLGNARGGWRLPQVDVPLASYSGRSAGCELSGSMRRLDAPRLKALYRDRNGYIERFNAAVDQAVEENRLVPEDAAALKAPLVRTLPAF